MSKQVVSDTGEVLEAPKFRSMWFNPYGITGQDLSNELEEVFEEIPAYAVDPKTGALLNGSSVPVIVPKGKINVHDKIQSFAQEVDLYHILEKFAYSGDQAIINARECQYGDISEMPDNLNDYCQLVNKQFNKIKSLNPELAKMIIDENASPEAIEAKANEIYQMRLDDYLKKDSKESEDNK